MFKQLIEVKTGDPDALVDHVTGYDIASAPGLQQVAVYDDRDRVGVYFIEAVFASREEAEENNSRPDTQAWAARLRDLIDEEPFYCNLEPLGELVGSKKGE